MLLLGKRAVSLEQSRVMVEKAIHNGTAWEKLRQLIIAQKGDVRVVDNPDLLPKASHVEVVKSPRSGYLFQIHARVIGEAAVLLGAGRAKKSDPIDHAVGIVVHHKVGDFIEGDAPLFTIHANDQTHH